MDRFEEARHLAGEALDITETPASAEFDYAISAVAPVVTNLILRVRDGDHVPASCRLPAGATIENRVKIDELYHSSDAKLLQSIADVA
ncbi:hypothetical protein [Agrobacterium arsenijevicii]|uniref:hypothetical protein n=1 Tax=Agrobacterium arsenijevicii TaxID=1585697 RepID=UPI001111F6AD